MTTPAVIQLTHYVDASLIARLFARFRGRYGNLWTSRASHDDDWEYIMEDWLEELSKFSIDQVRAAVNKTLTEFEEYPPTLGQLVELCMKESGMPSQQEVIRLMVARDFSHPLVKMVYDKIGSWTLTNGKAEEIERKVKEHYATLRAEFHVEPHKAWAHLEEYNSRPKELPAPSKIPSTEESKAFRECMNKCQEILQSKKIAGGGKTYKEFDANKVKKGHREFDQAVFDEYKSYLLSIPETETMILPPVYVMERNKFLNMRDQGEWLKKQGYVPPSQREGFASQKASDRTGNGRPTKMYKNWAHD
jgi:hypothetical protein